MICFSRTGLHRFISHLDWLAMVERILIRARLPVVYSEGYHRRPVMKASPPLPTGVASKSELLQLFFYEHCDAKDVARRLSSVVPEDIALRWVQPMRFKPAKNPYKAIAAAEYNVDFRMDLTTDEREKIISLSKSLMPDAELPDVELRDEKILKAVAGRLLEIKNADEFLNGGTGSLQLIGRMDDQATLHAAKLGFFYFESVPLKRFPLITKLGYLRSTDSGYEPVFVR